MFNHSDPLYTLFSQEQQGYCIPAETKGCQIGPGPYRPGRLFEVKDFYGWAKIDIG